MTDRQVLCIPVQFPYQERLAFTRCQVLPSVVITKLHAQISTLLGRQQIRGHQDPRFGPTHCICIDQDGYFDALLQRLGPSAQQILRDSAGPLGPIVDAASIAKQVLLSLVLIGRIPFRVSGTHTLVVARGLRKQRFRPSGYGPYPEWAVPLDTGGALMRSKPSAVVRHQPLKQLALRLDRYFNSLLWRYDRIAVALNSLWAGFCTPFADQSFLSLTTVLESVLSTQPMAITHILAERAAVILGRDSRSRVAVYETVKRLYDVRSKLAHGKVIELKSKTRLTVNTTFVSARYGIVSEVERSTLIGVVIDLINALLRDARYLSIVQAKRKEDRIRKDLDRLFLERLLS